MQIRIFNISVTADYESQEEMNRFLRNHRIIEVRQQYDETRGLWTFAVNYIEGANPSSNGIVQRNEKVDYKNILAEDKFAVFSQLREQRKIIAKDESIPAYAVFTDKELSIMAEMEDLSVKSILKIEGINKGRIEKYGERMLKAYYDAKENFTMQ